MNNKCDNCHFAPKYIIDDFGSAAQYFCAADLPSIYSHRAKLNMLKLWEEPAAEAVAEEAPKKAVKKAKAVAEVVVEEPIVEAVAEDEQNN